MNLIQTGIEAFKSYSLPSALVVFLLTIPTNAVVNIISLAGCVSATVSAVQFSEPNRNNTCPQANAGLGTPVLIDQVATLDASATSDADGQRLEFHWSAVQVPAGSVARPANPNSVRTKFVADQLGDYVFELTVIDSDGAMSVDTVRYSTGNTAPVANAGPDIRTRPGELVTLDAVGSFDPENTILSYRWQVMERPAANNSRLSGHTESRTSLVAADNGDYVISLIVSDGVHNSAPDNIRISTINTVPVAYAGPTRVLAPHSTLILDGSQSFDTDYDKLAYHWSLLTAPPGSQVQFQNPNIVSPELKLGGNGLYLFQLIVDDGVYVSTPSTVLIEVQHRRLENYDINDFLALTRQGGDDDTDGDGVPDPVDNCVLTANASQRDTDGDGIGNFCDADLNNDGIVNFLDLSIMKTFFFTADPDADLNGDGIVNFLDLAIIKAGFFKAPGPPGTIIWVSLTDGNWNDRLNWEPQVVPSAGVTAIVAVGADLTVTLSGGSATVKKLVLSNDLVMINSAFEASGAVELSGTINGSTTTINNTIIEPSTFGGIGVVELNAGTHTWTDVVLGVHTEFNNAVINPLVPGTGTLLINGGTHSWTGVTLGVDTQINNGLIVNSSDGLTVNSNLLIDAPTSPTGFHFLNDQTLGGSGMIVLNGIGNSVITEPRLLPSNSTTLAIASGITIRGRNATVGQSFANLVVDGNVMADMSGETLQLISSGWRGTGTLTATGGGMLQLGGNLDNAGDTISLDSGTGAVNLLAGASLRNTTINGTSGTVLSVNTGVTTFESIVFNGDLNLTNGALTNVFGGLTVNGTVIINAPSSPTGFQFNDSQTLDGIVTIIMNGLGNGVISEPRLLQSSSTTLTIGPQVTVRGGNATIGQSFANLVLQGDLISDVPGETLAIGGSNWSANSMIQAINGGEVRFFGNLDNTTSTLTLDTADGIATLAGGASLANATFNGTAGTNLNVSTGVTSMTAMTFNHDLTHSNGALTNVAGGLTLNGIATIVAPSSPTGFQFIETQSLLGNAIIVFNGVGNSFISEPRLLPSTGTTLTIGPQVTVRGGNATIGQSFANLVLQGDLISDVPSETLAIGGSNWSANSMIQAINGGEVRFFGNLDNTTSTLTLDTADGIATLAGGASLANATFNGTAGTNLNVSSGVTSMTAMTFNHDLTHENSALTNVAGGITINGIATIVAPSSPTGFQFIETQSLLGEALIVFDSAGNNVITEPRLLPSTATTLTIGPSVAIRGGKATVGQSFAGLVMNGSIDADLNLQPIRLSGANWSGNGALAANNGGIIELSGSLVNANLNFDTDDGSLVVLTGMTLENSTLSGTTGTNFSFNSGSHTIQDLVINADMTLNNGAIANVSDGLQLNGVAFINAPTSPTGMHFTNSQTLSGAATIVFDGAGNAVITEPRLLPSTATTLTIADSVVVRGGRGTLGNLFATLIIDGTVSADVDTINVSGNNVTNNGLIEALNGHEVDVRNMNSSPGTLHAGAGSTIALPDPLSLSATSNVLIDIASAVLVGSITANSGVTNYAGTLTVSAVDGFMPNLGNSFSIFSHSAFSGAFDTVNSVGLGAGQSFGVNIGPTSVIATVN